MSSQRNALFVVVGLFLLSSLAAQPAAPMSLDDCIRLALDAPSPVMLAHLDMDIADRERVVARSAFLPQSLVGVDYLYNSPSIDDPGRFSFLPFNAIREFAALVTVVQELDTSGRIRAEYQRARADQDVAAANLAIAERDLRRAVGASYYRLLLSRKLSSVLEGDVREAADFEERTRVLSEAGEAARADGVKATAQTASFRQALSAARIVSQLANQELASFWTDDVSQPLDLVDLFDQPVPEPHIDTRSGLYLARQEFRLFEAEERGFRAEARRARSELLPQLQLSFQWGVDEQVPGISFNDRGYAAFASLRWNVFDWSRTSSRIHQAKARAAQVVQSRQMADREFSKEYQSAVSRVRGSYEQISLARIQVTASEEDLRLSRVRYLGGEGPALEVVTAQAQLSSARSNYYLAITNYLVARLDLEVASGH